MDVTGNTHNYTNYFRVIHILTTYCNFPFKMEQSRYNLKILTSYLNTHLRDYDNKNLPGKIQCKIFYQGVSYICQSLNLSAYIWKEY